MEKQNNSRRNFIKTTTLATGAVITTPLQMNFMAPTFGNKKLKLAIVGCG